MQQALAGGTFRNKCWRTVLCGCPTSHDSKWPHLLCAHMYNSGTTGTHQAEVAPVTKGWHFPCAPKIPWAKPQRSRKPQAKGRKHNIQTAVQSNLDVHRDLPHKARRTPRSQLPLMQLADKRTGLCLVFNPRTFLQWAETLLAAPGAGRSPAVPWVPDLQRQMGELPQSSLGLCMMHLTVWEITTAQACTESNTFSFQVPP